MGSVQGNHSNNHVTFPKQDWRTKKHRNIKEKYNRSNFIVAGIKWTAFYHKELTLNLFGSFRPHWWIGDFSRLLLLTLRGCHQRLFCTMNIPLIKIQVNSHQSQNEGQLQTWPIKWVYRLQFMFLFSLFFSVTFGYWFSVELMQKNDSQCFSKCVDLGCPPRLCTGSSIIAFGPSESPKGTFCLIKRWSFRCYTHYFIMIQLWPVRTV